MSYLILSQDLFRTKECLGQPGDLKSKCHQIKTFCLPKLIDKFMPSPLKKRSPGGRVTFSLVPSAPGVLPIKEKENCLYKVGDIQPFAFINMSF